MTPRPPSSILSSRGAWLVGCAFLTLAVVGCTTDDADEPEGQQAGSVVSVVFDELRWEECENHDEGFVVFHPAGWDTTGTTDTADTTGPTCGAFQPGGDSGDPVIEFQVIEEPLATQVAEVEDQGGEVDSSILDRRSAAEVTTADDEGTRWLVDLRNARTLEIVGRTTTAVGAETLDEIVERMTGSLRWIDPRSSGEGLEPVGAPVDEAVEARPDQPAPRTSLVTDLRAAAQDGFDRVVIELDGDHEPGYRVAPVSEVPLLDEAGIPIDGDEYLEITISPASLLDDEGERSYEGPTRVPAAGGTVVREAVLVPSTTDEQLRVVVGLERAAGFAVATIPDPVRLVVDVIRDPVVGEDP